MIISGLVTTVFTSGIGRSGR